MPIPKRSFAAATLMILGFAAQAVAAEPVPFRPDEAILACHARGLAAIEAEEGQDARAESRFETDEMPDHMWHVTGKFRARFDDETRRVSVACDVSSSGIEVFTMEIEG